MNKALLWLDEKLDPAPARKLEQVCHGLTAVRSEADWRSMLPSASAAILHARYAGLKEKQSATAAIRRLPILWLCCETHPPRDSEWGYTLDGLLFPGMNRLEAEWALLAAVRTFHERKRWYEEKEQLLLRLEERKWVDQAKAILCEVKGIPEAEAYDFLRKQAMNERKRVGDVAASIVKVYQLIHG